MHFLSKEIAYMVTMDMAFRMLMCGILSPDEFRRYIDEMERKCACEEVRILYQSKLDIFLNQSVNGRYEIGNIHMEITKLSIKRAAPMRRKVAVYARVSWDFGNFLHPMACHVSYYTDCIRTNSQVDDGGQHKDCYRERQVESVVALLHPS